MKRFSVGLIKLTIDLGEATELVFCVYKINCATMGERTACMLFADSNKHDVRLKGQSQQ